MSTTPVPAPKKGNFFASIGHFFAKVFGNPTALRLEASVADLILPGFSPLINSAATALINAETAATAAGFQNDSGTQKMQIAISLFQSTYNAWAAQNNLSQEPAAVQNILQSVFNLLNELTATNSGTPGVTISPATLTEQVGVVNQL